ncbi:hypothetical protein Pint_33986 [Pistacia integerrima]|uniref:Uncharacterized protein n=1 Tax=Pistacia integerrima TaxID=434235 RepID=A0ACC0X373_9ROSI|nr:hypothetical protein Pint_33986 [Pistacia integerrima]
MRDSDCLYNTGEAPSREITKDQRKTVLIGCDGVNSVVAKWLGFKKPVFSGRFGMRGCADYKGNGELEDNPAKMKQFVLSNVHVPDQLKAVVQDTPIDSIIVTPLRYRQPWEVLRGNISKGGVCVVGDALHPMTPDIGQGGCSAWEDGVVLARTEDRKIGAFDTAGDGRGAVEATEVVEEGGLEGKCEGGGDLCYPQEHVAGGRRRLLQ